MTFNLRFLYILIYFFGGAPGVYTATEQFYYDAFTYIHSERAFIIFRPHLSSHDVWRHKGNKKNERLQIFDPYVLSLLRKKESID